MANKPSSRKAVRKTARRTLVNQNRRSRMRSFIRKVDEAISAGDSTVARAAFLTAESEIMRAAQKGVLPKERASRKVSRMSKAVKAIGQSA